MKHTKKKLLTYAEKLKSVETRLTLAIETADERGYTGFANSKGGLFDDPIIIELNRKHNKLLEMRHPGPVKKKAEKPQQKKKVYKVSVGGEWHQGRAEILGFFPSRARAQSYIEGRSPPSKHHFYRITEVEMEKTLADEALADSPYRP
jgi:hypothetical protein